MPRGRVSVSATFKVVETEEPIDEPSDEPEPDEPIETVCPRDDTCPIAPFTDTKNDEWYHDGIHFCVENGLMQGIGNNLFDPNGTLTRAQIVTTLWRMDGEKYVNYAMSFSDIPEGTWYTEAVRWAASEGIVKGYDDGTYKPDKDVTREELATILYRYAQSKGEGFVGASMFRMPFDDLMEISGWASEAVRWCYMKGVILGRTETTFVPAATATRAEAATMIQRFCECIQK